MEILKSLLTGDYDVLVGINLLREGLDLPEVSLIAILDADKLGFLRSATSLIQTIDRAARHVNGKVIMYADRRSAAMEEAIAETDRRRKIQAEYNRDHGITPRTITKSMQIIEEQYNLLIPKERKALIRALEKEMFELAKDLEFEKAAVGRDEIERLKEN